MHVNRLPFGPLLTHTRSELRPGETRSRNARLRERFHAIYGNALHLN